MLSFVKKKTMTSSVPANAVLGRSSLHKEEA